MVVAGVLSSLIGFTLQFTKLTALDSSSRQYARDSYAGKVSFLAVFGVSKAFANLSVALLSRLVGYKLTELSGWVLALAVMPPLFSGPGGGAAGGGWAAVVGACVVLGVQQGLCWSVTVLALILLMPGRRSGLASGLNETLGYVAVAAAAPVYGLLEPLAVSCGWAVPLSDLSPACRTAAETAAATAAAATTAAAAAGGLGALGALPGVGGATGAAANGTAAAISEQLLAAACSTADNWQSACVGECVCHGYNTLASKALLLLLPAGLLLTALLMGEPAAAVAAAMAAAAGRRRTEAQAEAGQGAGVAAAPDVTKGKTGGVEMKAFGWKGRLGGSGGGAGAGGEVGRYARVRGEECPQPGMAALSAGSSSSAAVNGHGDAVPGGGSSSSSNGDSGLQPSLQPVLLPVSTPPAAIGGYSRRQQLGGEAAEEKEGLMRGTGAAGAERQGLLSGTAPASSGLFAPGGGGGEGGGGGGSWLSRVARRCSLPEVLYFSWTNPSTSIMCAAGLLSNALTSLAWGLLLAWARDDPSLRVPGPGRNLLASAYSFLKGLTQLLSGGVSDAAGVGRRPPVVLGLLLNGAGLLTAAFGAGWGGAALALSGVSQGSSPQEVEARRSTAYGYLMLASCLMGAGAGVFYPVMPAAMADHARDWAMKQPRGGGGGGASAPESQGLLTEAAAEEEEAAAAVGDDDDDDGVRAGKRLNAPAPHAHPHHQPHHATNNGSGSTSNGGSSTSSGSGSGSAASHALAAAMSTFRFWRDLGYAVGALGGPAADALGVEATLLGTAGVCLGMAGLVGWRYEEVAVPAAGDAGGSSHGWH